MNESSGHRKSDFDSIYDQPDPRAYFTTLEPFDYRIPQHGVDLFRHVLSERSGGSGPVATVLDVCCSYGVNAMLLKTDLGMDDLYARYRAPEVQALEPDELADLDRQFIREHERVGAPRVFGLDAAANAVAYAVDVGSLDGGAVENLESDDPSAALADLLATVDLITITGGIGYVTERTFDRLMAATPSSTWVAAMCLRTYDYQPFVETFARHGLRTERWPGTFRQRRFTDETEQQWAFEQVRSRGLDPTGVEDDGYFHAEFFLSRPAD